MTDPKLDLLQGTLDLMVLQTLAAMGDQHVYGIARRIEQISGDTILLNQGTIYAALVRLQNRGWISAEWGVSDNNRKAKYYAITRSGRKQPTLPTRKGSNYSPPSRDHNNAGTPALVWDCHNADT